MKKTEYSILKRIRHSKEHSIKINPHDSQRGVSRHWVKTVYRRDFDKFTYVLLRSPHQPSQKVYTCQVKTTL